MSLKELRKEIDEINKNIIKLIVKRMKLAEEIVEYKKANALPIYIPEREKEVIENVRKIAKENNLDENMIEEVFWKIIEHTREMQKEAKK